MSFEYIIRPALSQDWNEIISIYNYYILNSAYNFEYDTHTLQSRLSWFEQFQNQSVYQLLVGCNTENQVIGYAATKPFSPMPGYRTSATISIYCYPEYTNIGLGSKLLQRLIIHSQSTELHKMYAGITTSNHSSIQFFIKFGFIQAAYFKEVGYKFNQYWDVIWLEKNLELVTQ